MKVFGVALLAQEEMLVMIAASAFVRIRKEV